MKAFRTAVSWAALLVLVAGSFWLGMTPGQGWRLPSRIIMPRRVPQGIEFDAAYEAELSRSPSLPMIMKQRWEAMRQYADTLSQPVVIQGWQGDTATCELFFGTNRGLIAATADSDKQWFGNEVIKDEPLFGRATITMPFRLRGVDPKIAGATSNGTPADGKSVQIESVRRMPSDAAIAGLSEQIARSRQRDVLLFVHGFNVDFESALVRTAQLALDIPFNGAVVSYCWPTQGGALNYPTDEGINADSVEPFTRFLQRLIRDVPVGTRVNILVHSMGNRMVLQAIGRLDLPAEGKKLLANVVLCAPDVGESDFRNWAPAAVERCERVTLYASRSDSALIASKHLHREARVGDAHRPLCLAEIDTIDASAVDFDLLLGHSYYGSNRNVLTDLYFVLKEQRRPQERQYLTQAGSASHPYWEFAEEAPFIRCSWRLGEGTTTR